MYFESVAALEKTIKEVSRADCSSVQLDLLKSVEEAKSIVYKTQKFLYTPVIKSRGPIVADENGFLNVSKSDSAEWVELLRRYKFGTIRRSKYLYSIGVVLVPHVYTDSAGIYTNVWYDLTASGGREFVWARSGNMIEGANNINLTKAHADHLDEESGEITAYAYSFVIISLYMQYSNWDPNGAKNFNFSNWPEGYAPPGWSQGTSGAQIQRWREPLPWYASDNNPYVFNSFDVIFAPPPPPHPWSAYKYIYISGFFIFTAWEEAMAQYGLDHPGTEVIVFDATTNYVYVTSDNRAMIDKSCVMAGRTLDITLDSCVVTISHLRKGLQDAWQEVKGEEDTFRIADLDGEKHFLRRAPLFRFTPDGGRGEGAAPMNACILWVRPYSSVEGEVRNALYLLIGFSAAVLLLDVVLAVCEVLVVGVPLIKLSAAMTHLHDMDLVNALQCTDAARTQVIAVTQIRNVINGLLFAVRNLEQYKAFLPSSLFQAEDTADDGSSEHSDTKNTVTRTVSSTQSRTASRSSAAVRTGNVTQLQTASAKGALLAVRAVAEVGHAEYTTLIGYLQDVVSARRGMLHGIQAVEHTLFHISWGLTARCPLSSCVKYASEVASLLPNAPTRVSSAIVSGSFHVGNVGNSTLRGVAVYGIETSKLAAFQAFSAHCMVLSKAESVTVLSRRTASVLEGQCVSHYLCKCDSGDRMCQLGAETAQQNEEWMYQLDRDQSTKDPVQRLVEGEIAFEDMARQDMTELQQLLFNSAEDVNMVWSLTAGRLGPVSVVSPGKTVVDSV